MTENLKSARSAKIGKVFKVARKELGLTKVEVSNSAFMNIRYINAICLLYTSPSPRDLSTSRMPSSA